MRTVAVTVASCSTPQGHRDEIHASLRQRVATLVQLLNQYGVVLIALQESGPLLGRWWRTHPRWMVGLFRPNSVGAGGRFVGTAIARLMTLTVHDERLLRYRVPRRVLRMKFPVALCEKDRAAWVFIGGHILTRRDASQATRDMLNALLIGYARACLRLGLSVIVCIDANDGSLPQWKAAGFAGYRHGVDWILAAQPVFDARGVFAGVEPMLLTDCHAVTEVHGTVSDHHAMPVATCHVPVQPHAAGVRRLPKQ